jgi:hypothetical protein
MDLEALMDGAAYACKAKAYAFSELNSVLCSIYGEEELEKLVLSYEMAVVRKKTEFDFRDYDLVSLDGADGDNLVFSYREDDGGECWDKVEIPRALFREKGALELAVAVAVEEGKKKEALKNEAWRLEQEEKELETINRLAAKFGLKVVVGEQ